MVKDVTTKPVGAGAISATSDDLNAQIPAGEGEVPAVVVPGTVRNEALQPRAGDGTTVRSVPPNPHQARDVASTAERIRGLLSLGVFDWAVTDREATKALDELHRVSDPRTLALVVDAVGPELMSRLDANIPARVRPGYEATIFRIQVARNAPIGIDGDVEQVITALKAKLEGFLELDFVSTDGARDAIDQVRKLAPNDQERLLDELGPSRSYRIINNLADADRTAYGPTVATVRRAFFGAIKRECEAQGLAPSDQTNAFSSVLSHIDSGTNERPRDLNDYVYFLVPGLVTEHQPGYMDANEARLVEMGVEVRRSKIDTDADIDTNAAQISAEVAALAQETGKKVVVLSHSKGGPDMAAALQNPATEDHVHRFIAMQPACGTPVASTLMDSPLGSTIEGALTNLLGAANGNALRDLGFKEMKQRFRAGRKLSAITVALATTMGDNFSALRAVSDLIESRYGEKSDGLVPVEEQFVPSTNGHIVHLDGVDHAAPVARQIPGTPAPKYSPGDLTEALVCLALRL